MIWLLGEPSFWSELFVGSTRGPRRIQGLMLADFIDWLEFEHELLRLLYLFATITFDLWK